MIVRQVHGCAGCSNEVTVDRFPDGRMPQGMPTGWNRLGFEGGQLFVDLCTACVARVLDACPKLRDTMTGHIRKAGE